MKPQCAKVKARGFCQFREISTIPLRQRWPISQFDALPGNLLFSRPPTVVTDIYQFERVIRTSLKSAKPEQKSRGTRSQSLSSVPSSPVASLASMGEEPVFPRESFTMLRFLCAISAVWLGALLSESVPHPTLMAEESLTARLPAGAFFSAELSRAEAALSQIRESELLQSLTASEPYQKWALSKNGRKFQGGRALLEGQLGINLWDAASRLFGNRVSLALYLSGEAGHPVDGVVLIHFADDAIGPLLQEKLIPWLQLAQEKMTFTQQAGLLQIETRDGKASLALQGRWGLFCTKPALRDAVLASLGDQPDPAAGESLAKTPVWDKCPPLLPDESGTHLSLTFDAATLRKGVGQDRGIPAILSNPLASLLFGGLTEITAVAPAVYGELSWEGSRFSAAVRFPTGRQDVDPAHQTLLTATGGSSLPPNVPRQVGAFAWSRDWADWYRQREHLLETRVLPEFDKFETGLATFFPGKDFAEDVLCLMNPPMSFVAAWQTYPHLDGKPGLQLPAFAVVMDLNDPQRGADVLQLFVQTLGTITNLEAGKGGRQPWIMSSESHADVQITFARYLDRPTGTDLPAIFNYQPAAALVGRHYIAATSLELCRDLVDSLQKNPLPVAGDGAQAGRNFELNLSSVHLAELLEANRSIYTARRVQQGLSLERAQHELELLKSILQKTGDWQFTADVAAHQFDLRLTIQPASR